MRIAARQTVSFCEVGSKSRPNANNDITILNVGSLFVEKCGVSHSFLFIQSFFMPIIIMKLAKAV